MTSILDIIQQGKRDLLRGEIAMTQRMLAAYELVWLEVERQLLRLEDNLLAAEALPWGDDEAVQAWLRQQDWYRQLMASVEAQFARFNTDATAVLGRTQVEAVGVSRDASGKIRDWITGRARAEVSAAIRADVRPQVFERWISATLPDSPLRASIERHGVEAAKVIERRMTEGIGSGKGVRSMVQGIIDDLGMDSPKPYELTTLVRTETMRAYRGSFRDDMEAMGADIVPQMEWLAAHSARTCPACLAMDGRRFPLDGLIDKFHVACRCVWRPVVNEDLVPGANPPRKLGAQWFAEQDEATQRKILRSPTRYQAFQDGVPLSEMVGERGNAVWGPSVYVKPIRDLPKIGPTAHPNNPAVFRGPRGVWGDGQLPVMQWESPEHRVVLPEDLRTAIGADEPVVRWASDKRALVELTKARDEAVLSDVSHYITGWEYVGREAGKSDTWRVLFQAEGRWHAATISRDTNGSLNIVTVFGSSKKRFVENRLRGLDDVVEKEK